MAGWGGCTALWPWVRAWRGHALPQRACPRARGRRDYACWPPPPPHLTHAQEDAHCGAAPAVEHTGQDGHAVVVGLLRRLLQEEAQHARQRATHRRLPARVARAAMLLGLAGGASGVRSAADVDAANATRLLFFQERLLQIRQRLRAANGQAAGRGASDGVTPRPCPEQPCRRSLSPSFSARDCWPGQPAHTPLLWRVPEPGGRARQEEQPEQRHHDANRRDRVDGQAAQVRVRHARQRQRQKRTQRQAQVAGRHKCCARQSSGEQLGTVRGWRRPRGNLLSALHHSCCCRRIQARLPRCCIYSPADAMVLSALLT